MGALADAIVTPIGGQPISAASFGVAVKTAIDSIEDRVDAQLDSVYKRKAADQNAVTASASYVADDTLFWNVTAGSIWQAQFNLLFSANTTQALKIAFAVPTGSTLDIPMCLYRAADGSLAMSAVGSQGQASGTALPSFLPGRTTASDLVPVQYNITVAVGGTAGSIAMNFGHSSAGAGVSGIMRRGSHVRANRIA